MSMSECTNREGKLIDFLHDEMARAREELSEFEDDEEDQNCYANGYETGKLHAMQQVKLELARLVLADDQGAS